MTKPNRQTMRLKSWNYSWEGYYFVTICIQNHKCVLGNIVNGKISLSFIGKIIEYEWLNIPRIFANASLDYWVIMPNHIHGIIIIRRGLIHQTPDRGMMNHAPTQWRLMQQCGVSSGKIIRYFKAKTTKLIHDKNHAFSWQRNYYDHIIRNEQSLNQIREYIQNNPLKWDMDVENTANQHLV